MCVCVCVMVCVCVCVCVCVFAQARVYIILNESSEGMLEFAKTINVYLKLYTFTLL